MAKVYPHAYFADGIVPIGEANMSIASSAVLYGLSVYTVMPLVVTTQGIAGFRLTDHYTRLVNSARIIGIDTFTPLWTLERFTEAVRAVVEKNELTEPAFLRATVHVHELVPGTRSRGLASVLSIFLYEASPILPQNGARVKTSVWRRIPDYAIPSRAKVNGAYVNSVLGKQDAIDSGYDDCVFLDSEGQVCELSAANIFVVRDGTLYTPGHASDILEGITRKTVLELAREMGIPAVERSIDLTELYVADELFACGTSSYIAPIIEVDRRVIGLGIGSITKRIRDQYAAILQGTATTAHAFLTPLA